MPEPEVEIVANDAPGSVPTPEPTPAPTPSPEPQATPAPAAEPAKADPAPAEPEPTLVELPDGRKVAPEEVVKEYKNLLTDYTKKSQDLARLSGDGKNINNPNPEKPKENEWVPQTYEEILQKAEERVFQKMKETQTAEEESKKALATQVDTEISEIRKDNPNLNENALFQHAVKYGFHSLKSAYSNMKDMQEQAKKIQDETTKNIQKRAAEPISGAAGNAKSDDSVEYAPSHGSALDFLRSIK